MRRYWLIAGFMLGWVFIASSAARAVSPCPDSGGTEFIVDTDAEADLIAAGYNNGACMLTIKVKVTPTAAIWQAEAKKIRILGNSVVPVEIINSNPSSRLIF